MLQRKAFLYCVFYLLATCAETNLGGNLSIESGGGPAFVPGSDLTLSETDAIDFQSGTLNQVAADSSGALRLQRNFIGETGRVIISNEINLVPATTVNFRQSYSNPVIVAYIATRNNPEPLDARVTNVTATGFDLFIEDPNNDGIASPETVIYMVIEAGRYDFANGLSIEADIHSTSSEHSAGDPFGGDIIAFSSAFIGTPVVLHSLNSYNNGDFKSSLCDSATNTQITLEQETADTGTATAVEDIAWIALSQGSGSLVNTAFDIALFNDGGSHGIDNGVPQDITYSGFTVAPDVIVKGSSGGGADGYWMRGAGTWTNLTHDSYSEEDEVGDAETSHANETFNSAAFSPDSNIGVYFASGSRVSEPINLSVVKIVEDSSLVYNATRPAGTTASVETNVSFDAGNSWKGWVTHVSGQPVAGLDSGVNVEQGLLRIRINLSSTDEEETPLLTDLNLSVTAASSE